MVLNEIKQFFENIKTFRHLLTEGVNEKDMETYIQNHEWVYIYYKGDDNNKMGYRTIRPYVLGMHKTSGNVVLRAWQDNPKNSETFQDRPTRKDSYKHDYWTDEEGMKPGWRMFRLDKISKVYPIGKKFNDVNGLVMIPAGYHEGGDDDMSTIIAYVSTKTQPDFEYKYDKDFYGNEKKKSEITMQKWDSIRRGNKNNRKINAQDVIKLKDIASNVYKKGINSFLVVIDDKKNYQLVSVVDKDKKNIPDSAIVGSLANLYDTLVKGTAPANDKFFSTGKDNAIKKIKEKAQKTEINEKIPTIPFDKKPFFKS